MTIIIIWELCSVVAFLLFCRASLRTWGSVSRGDVLLFAVLSSAGPASLFTAPIIALVGALDSGAFAKQVWPR